MTEVKCNRVIFMKGPKGALCVGFTKKAPPNAPKGDVIHLCWLDTEHMKKTEEEERCYPNYRVSATPDEACTLGVHLIRTTAFYEVEKREEQSFD